MLATTLDPDKVSPGVAGFLAVFALALATWLLIRSMVGHLRKVRYRAEHEAAEAERAAAAERDAAERDADAEVAGTAASAARKTRPAEVEAEKPEAGPRS